MSSVSIEHEHSMSRGFTAAEQQALRDEDSTAFAHVTGILLFVVSAGLVLGIVSVLLILLGEFSV